VLRSLSKRAKMHHFKSKNPKIFWGGETLSPNHIPVRRDLQPLAPDPFGFKNLAPALQTA